MTRVIRRLDAVYYLAAQIGIFFAAYRGSVAWTIACGFVLTDGALTILWEQAHKEDKP